MTDQELDLVETTALLRALHRRFTAMCTIAVAKGGNNSGQVLVSMWGDKMMCSGMARQLDTMAEQAVYVDVVASAGGGSRSDGPVN